LLHDAIVRREEKTKERIYTANELYSLAAVYCNIGKLIFKDKNPAKYRAYIINKPSHHKTKKTEDKTIVAEEN